MQLLVNKFVNFLQRPPRTNTIAGLYIGNADISIVLFNKGDEKAVNTASLSDINHSNLNEKLGQLLKPYSTEKCLLHVCIGSNYELLAIDKPDVDEQNMATALKYAGKDILSGNLDELVVDYFDIPEQPLGQHKANLVACNRHLILTVLEAAKNANMAVSCIDIEELCYKNAFPEIDDAVMVLSLQKGQELSLQIHKQGKLYFYRRLRGYNNIYKVSEEELTAVIADNLSLEIQRSLDYFESQLKQAPVKRIYFALSTTFEKALIDAVSVNFTIPILGLKSWLRNQLPEGEHDISVLAATCAAMSLFEGTRK